MRYSDDPGEPALALARLLNAEDLFIRLWRRPAADLGAVLARQLTQIIRLYRPSAPRGDPLLALLDDAAQDLFHDRLDQAVQGLGQLPDHITPERFAPLPEQILRHCAANLAERGSQRREDLILVLLALHAGSSPKQD